MFVHYQRKPDQIEKTAENIRRLLKQGHKLICLPEETSVWLNNDEMKIIGQKPAEIFNGKEMKKVNPMIMNYSNRKN